MLPPMTSRARLVAGLVALTCVVGGSVLARRLDPDVTREDVVIDGTPATRLRPASGPRRGTAVLAHGITANRRTLLVIGERLAREGFEVLAIDLPGHGESRLAFRQPALERAVQSAARALEPSARVDVYVGHSLGASVGAVAHGNGFVPRPRLAVAIGAYGMPDPEPATRSLFATGRLDVLATPEQVETFARRYQTLERHRADLLIGPSDHVLEPYDPVIVRGIVDAALETIGAPPRHPPGLHAPTLLRVAGVWLVLAAAPLIAVAVPPRAARDARDAALQGLASGGLWVALVVLAMDAAWVGLRPQARHVAPLLVLTLLAAAVPHLTTRVAGSLLRGLTPLREATIGFVPALAPFGLALLSAGAGQWFFAMMLTILGGVALGAAAFGVVVARRAQHALAGHVAFAVIVAYWPALCVPVFL